MELIRARQLFALALETPGGLKVQTIHAFCTHLLHLFPFEANVAARFTVLDEAQGTQLLDRLVMQVLLEAAGKPNEPLGRALAGAIAAAADITFRDMINEAIRARDRLKNWIDGTGSIDAAMVQLSRTLGIDPADNSEKVEAAFFGETLIAPSEWPAVAAALAEGFKTDQEQSRRFASLHTLTGDERLKTLLSVFCTATLEPRKQLTTKTIRDNHPALFQRLMAEQERVCKLLARRRAIAARDRTAALVTIANTVIDRFAAEKDRRGLLDYDDLIEKTLALLANVSAAWVHYKLDQGIDHLLIDEAQDTSPKQWSIVEALVGEFFAGAGAQSSRRTIFAVGDEKQSIFSFQGAVPREFETMRRKFDTASRAVERDLLHVRLSHSFRSGANVLAAVDKVFEAQDVAASITSDEAGITPHEALPNAAPGLVEIWDTEKPSDRRDMEGWAAPFDEVTEVSPVVRLADRIAGSVAAWQRQGKRPGDVLILVRRRGALFEAVIRALKNAGIPVAGADRLVLTEHIAVMDLMVLADALLLPQDDLALATVLKSPLFGFDDDDLFAIAWDRGRMSLRAALARNGGEKFAAASARLDRLTEAALRETPFAFYAWLLGAEHGRKRILARLGHEAADALDEFLNLALDYERSETPSLQGFVAWMRAAQSEVKRDMEMDRDEVRVMTVHGAKGLEAPIVILADTTTPPQGWHPPRLMELPAGLVWAGPKGADVGPMTAAREASQNAAKDEYRRLLYVAMTRAIDRLIVCGIDSERKRPDGCWYDLVVNALAPHSGEEPADFGEHTVLRYRTAPAEFVATLQPSTEKPTAIELPSWLTQATPADEARTQPIKPSRAGEDYVPSGPTSGDERKRALKRGNLMHRLMQSLPDIPLERRDDATRRYLARNGKDFAEAELDAIRKQALAVLGDPRFAALFAPGSRAEVPIVGRLGNRPVPSGVVDRLTVTADAVLIVDYKTNRPAPRRLEDVPPAYVTQLAIYRAVLARLYPDRPVRAALLWTDLLHLMEVPAARLDSAQAALTSP